MVRLRGAADVERLARRRSIATWAADIAFWLLYGGGVAVIVYAIYVAPRP